MANVKRDILACLGLTVHKIGFGDGQVLIFFIRDFESGQAPKVSARLFLKLR